jgi:hypothetical protein
MQELRFVAVSEDGQYAVLGVPGRSARFTLPIDERLRAVALGQTSRLAQYEIEVESPLRPKEIQARIRAGETVEEIADAAGIAVERVRWFEGPVLAERAYMAERAQSASVRRPGDAIPPSPGPRLGEIVTERLKVFGADPEDAQWDARKRDDGSWQVQLAFITGGRLHTADWIFDPRRRHVLPDDDNAARMSLPGGEPPPASPALSPAPPAPGQATVTQLAPRLSTASPFGPVALGNGTRHERPGPGRPAAPEPRIAEREAPEPREAEAPAAAAQAAPPGRAVPPARHARPAQDAQGRRETAPPQAAAESPATPAAPAAASPGTQVAASPGTQVAASPGTPVTVGPAGPAAPAAPPAEAQPPASAEAAPAEAAGDQAARQGRKTARGRRSSVPSWDEIMFGNSRGRD